MQPEERTGEMRQRGQSEMWSMRRNQSAIGGYKGGGRGPQIQSKNEKASKNWDRLLRTQNDKKNLDCPTAWCKFSWVSLEMDSSQNLLIRVQMTNTCIYLALGNLDQRNQEGLPDFWSTELWDNKWVLF